MTLSINVYTMDPTYLKTLFPGGSKPWFPWPVS